MVSYDIQDFGGLEEYAVNLAIELKNQGQDVSYLSAAWVNPENQYCRRLKASLIPLVQPPEWVSKPASDWDTKERILRGILWLLSPLTVLLGLGAFILNRRKRSPRRAWTGARNWLRGQLTERFIGRDYRKLIGIILLNWWNLRRHPDIFHIQGYTTTLLFVVHWAHSRGIPVIYEEHQTPDPQFNWWSGFENTMNMADRVIAVSEKSAQGLRDVCKVVRPILVRGPLLPDPYISGLKREYSSSPGRPFTVSTVARLYITKGLVYLLEACTIVKKIHPDVDFRVYGEGELHAELVAKAASLGLDGNRIFAGAFTNREQLSRILEETDVFLLSSILEGQPLALVEAMAYGCPIVSTDVGGIPELIQDGVNGLLCPAKDPQCLAQKIMLLIENPELRKRLGRAAREFYENSPFQAKSAAIHFISIYYEVVLERQRLQGTNP